MKYIKKYEDINTHPIFSVDDYSDVIKLSPEHRAQYEKLKYKIDDYVEVSFYESIFQIHAIDLYDEFNYLVVDINDDNNHHWVLEGEIDRKLDDWEVKALKYNL